MNWHVDQATMERYANASIDPANAASIEAHVLACAPCRTLAAAVTRSERLDRVWTQVHDTIDRPRRTWAERLLTLIAVPEHTARLIGATPALQASWLLGVAAGLGFAVLAAHNARNGLFLFLILAPVVPLIGVAAAYGPGLDPAFEVGVAAPMRGFHLLLVRAIAVLTASAALTGVAAAALPQLGWTAIAWLLPAVALTATSLALSSAISPAFASGIVTLLWLGVAGFIEQWSSQSLAAFTGRGQIVWALVAFAAGAVVALRHHTFDVTKR